MNSTANLLKGAAPLRTVDNYLFDWRDFWVFGVICNLEEKILVGMKEGSRFYPDFGEDDEQQIYDENVADSAEGDHQEIALIIP